MLLQTTPEASKLIKRLNKLQASLESLSSSNIEFEYSLGAASPSWSQALAYDIPMTPVRYNSAAVSTPHSQLGLATHSSAGLLTHSLTYLLTYLLTHLLTHSRTYLLTHALTYSLTHSLVDRLSTIDVTKLTTGQTDLLQRAYDSLSDFFRLLQNEPVSNRNDESNALDRTTIASPR